MNDLANATTDDPAEQAKEPPQAPSYECGCIFFDDHHMHQHGWAARAGQRAQYISGTHELASDTVWITDLAYNLIREAGFEGNVRFRRDEFLRQRPHQVAASLGLDPKEDVARTAEATATLFSRVMSLSETLAGIDHVPANLLRMGIREKIDPVYDKPVQERVSEALNASTVYWLPCEKRPMEGERYRFRLPQITHARNVLCIPLPTGKWHKMPNKKLPEASREAVCDWVYNTAMPVLVQATVNWIDPDYAALINFGAGAWSARGGRSWITQVELTWLAQIAEVKIHEAYECDDYLEPQGYRDLLKPLDEFAELSLSAGLFAENVWCAAATKLPVPKNMAVSDQNYAHSPTPFLRAQDRLQCLMGAITLVKHGMAVEAYGTGQIQARVPKEMEPEQIIEIADEADLMPPPLEIDQHYDLPDRQDSELRRTMRLLFAQNRREELFELDKEIVAKILQQEQGD